MKGKFRTVRIKARAVDSAHVVNYDKQLFRLVKILNLLQNRAAVTTASLADEFNVSARTAQRDMLRLIGAGFPIANDETADGRYAFVDGYNLKQLPLSEQEAALLTFTCDASRQFGAEFETAYKSLFSKLMRQGRGESPFYLLAARAPQGKGQEGLFRTAQSAIEQRRHLRVFYRPLSGKPKNYLVEPLKLVFFDGYCYLVSRMVGQDWLLKNRLDRIGSVELQATTFKPPRNIDKVLDASNSMWFTEKRDKKVLLFVSAEIADTTLRRKSFPMQKVRKRYRDGSILLETTLCHYMEAIPTILTCIPYIEVVSPKDLAATIRAEVQEYLSRLSK